MKQFLAIHHLKRTGDFPKASDQEELEDVMQKIFKDKVVITLNFTLNPFIMIHDQFISEMAKMRSKCDFEFRMR